MLRISETGDVNGRLALKVEGRLASDWVSELGKVCRHLAQTHQKILLDIKGITFVDQAGVDLLRMLASEGVKITSASALIKSLYADGVET